MRGIRLYIPSIISCAIVFIYVLVLSLYSLWIGDDIMYQFNFATEGEISSIRDVVNSQVAHYFNNNGRFVAHFLVQIILVFGGKIMFSLLNAFVFTALTILVCLYAGKELSDWKSLAFISALLLFGLQTKFVPTCQIGYPWMFFLIMGFILYYRNAHKLLPSWYLLFLIPFSIIAGWSQEALVIGVVPALCLEALICRRLLSVPQKVMLCGFIIGSILLCLSPASLHRTGEIHASTDLLSPSLLSLAKFFCYLRVTYILFAVVVVRLIKDRSVSHVYKEDSFLWNAWAVLVVFNLVLGVFGNRQLFGIEFISSVLILKMVKKERAINCLLCILTITMLVLGYHKMLILDSRTSIYNNTVAQSCASLDGMAYEDLSSSDVSFHESDPCDPFSWYVKESIDKLLHAQGDLKGNQHYDIIPTICKNIQNECVIHNEKGSIVAAVRRDHLPASVSVSRELRVFGLRHTLPVFQGPLDKPIFQNEDFVFYQLFEKIPFVHNVEANIILKK